MKTIDAAIVGGGISGLATAWWLKKRGWSVAVLERGADPGGTMQTVSDQGWMIETGPNSALETTPLFRTLFDDCGLRDEVVYGNEAANRRYILRDGRLHILPMSPPMFLKSRLWSTLGKLRLLLEPFIGRAAREESIAEFVRRRLGREFLDYAINPFVAGVYAGNPEQLSVRAAFPKLFALERDYRSLIIGQIRGARKRGQRAETAKDRARLFSFRSGMQQLPRALGAALGDAFRGGVTVTAVKPQDDGWRIQFANGDTPIDAKTVLTAVPTRETGRLWADVEPSIPRLLEAIPYPPVAEVFLGFKREQVSHPLDGFGFLVPQLEPRSILGTLWSSTLFPGRAPDGHVALTTFVGGSRQPELTQLADGSLIDVVMGDLRAILGISGAPIYVRINRWDRAIPQYAIGHLDIVEKVRQRESLHPGLFMSGNFIGGISVGDCVIQSEFNAVRIDAYLRPRVSSK